MISLWKWPNLSNRIVSLYLSIRLDSMLQTIQLPTCVAHLTSGLADVDRDHFAHFNKDTVYFFQLLRSVMQYMNCIWKWLAYWFFFLWKGLQFEEWNQWICKLSYVFDFEGWNFFIVDSVIEVNNPLCDPQWVCMIHTHKIHEKLGQVKKIGKLFCFLYLNIRY